MAQFAKVVCRRTFFGSGVFTFAVPPVFQRRIAPGQIVKIPLKDFVELAVVWDTFDRKPEFETKNILAIETPPVLTAQQMQLAQQIAQENCTPLPKVVANFLPEKIFQSDGLPPVATFLVKNDQAKLPARLGSKQQRVLDLLHEKGEVQISTLRQQTGAGTQSLHRLLERELVHKVSWPLFQENAGANLPQGKIPPVKPFQAASWRTLHQQPKVLLTGIPGSGKSFLLRKLCREMLAKNFAGQILILVSEILLAFEVEKHFSQIFPPQILQTFHSKMTTGEKFLAWWKVRSGQAKIILASRAGVFLPFAKLQLVAQEEFHDDGFKNQQAPRFSTEKVAADLAKIFQAKIIFSSATPTAEKILQVKNGHLALAETRRAPRGTPSSVSIVDLKNEQEAKNFSPLSKVLQLAIAENLQKGRKVILFLPRRGAHCAVFCPECGQAQRCSFCHVALTHHFAKGQGKADFLLCHHCCRLFPIFTRCEHCGGTRAAFAGTGTQKVEQILRERFPQAKILRADRDSFATQNQGREIFMSFFEGDGQILLGTQIVTKSFDVENIGLVGILLADLHLQIPDFRAGERTFQHIAQACGRTAAGTDSQTVVQTFQPEHPAILAAVRGDWRAFWRGEIPLREKFFLPPFSQILKVTFANVKKETALAAAKRCQAKLAKALQGTGKAFCAPALVPRKFGKFHVNVICHCENVQQLLGKVRITGGKIDTSPTSTV